jgi:hypothetical protein
MKLFEATFSYLVYAIGVAGYGWLYLLVPQTTDQFGVTTYSPDVLPYFSVGITLATLLMIITPYFGIAALQGAGSVWKRAVELIERHISFPFLSGLFLFYSRTYVGLLGVYSTGNYLGYNSNVGAEIAIYTCIWIVVSIMVLLASGGSSTKAAAVREYSATLGSDQP